METEEEYIIAWYRKVMHILDTGGHFLNILLFLTRVRSSKSLSTEQNTAGLLGP